MLDHDTCYRALKARDHRFDGKFFTGVTSTGVYCRPVCPVRPPKAVNVRFFHEECQPVSDVAGHIDSTGIVVA